MRKPRIKRPRIWRSPEEKLAARLSRIEAGLTGETAKKIKRLVEAIVPGRTVIRVNRYYPGVWQRSEGAWSWGAQLEDREIGSQWPMGEVLKWKLDEIEKYEEIQGQIWLYPPTTKANQGGAEHGNV